MGQKRAELYGINKSYGVRLKRDLTKNKYVYLMALPVVVYYVIFHYITMGGIIIAFQDFKPAFGFLGSKFVGLRNFVDFFNSIYAFRTIKNTFMLSILQIVFGFPAPILLALLLNEVKQIRFKRTVQTITYMPHFISMVVVCGMVIDFTISTGIVNDIIVFFGGQRTNLLANKDAFRPIFIVSGIWQEVGWGSIIYLATLSNIDPTLYEAATVDGAGRFKQAVHITLPGLIPTIATLLIMRLGHVMSQGFEKIILLYNSLTYETADVISSFIYRSGLQESKFSPGAAVGLFNTVINFVILISANTFSKRVLKESLW